MHRPDRTSRSRPTALALRAAACLLLPAAAAAGTGDVVPDVSTVSVYSTMASPTNKVSDDETQTGTLLPLAAEVFQSGGTGGTLTHEVDASATFESERSGTVHLNYVRADTKEFGTSISFSGQALFRYDFTLAEATPVTVHYDLLATETPEPPTGPSWWGMQGFDINVDGAHDYVNYGLPEPEPPSPVVTQGSFSVTLAPGLRRLEIYVISSATANQWGVTRTMSGTFRFEIGAPEPWEDLGHALAGSQGEPQLTGLGSLVAGSPVELTLAQALAGAPAFLVVGFGVVNQPFKGGVLVPAPDVVMAGLAVDAGGAIAIATTWPAGVPSGLDVALQYWVPDAAGPAGFAASNGVGKTTP